MAGKLFEYVIVYHPRRPSRSKDEKDDGDGQVSEILVDLKRVIARDEKTVAIMAAREIPEKYLERLDQVEICIRPF